MYSARLGALALILLSSISFCSAPAQFSLQFDDNLTARNFNLSSVKECGAKATSIEGVFACALAFNKEHPDETNCLYSSSAFRQAYLASNISANPPFSIFRAFAKDEKQLTSHRFLLLKTSTGLSVLDPYWCGSGNYTSCEKSSTARYLSDESSPNYNGKVLLLEPLWASG